MKKIDLYDIYTEQHIMSNKPKKLKGTAEDRHHQIQDSISQHVMSFAHEPRLQGVIKSTYYK